MAGPVVAREGWRRRVALTLAVLGLYLVPFYQKYAADPREQWPNLKITRSNPADAAQGEQPYFSEDFVNQARPGMVCHVSGITAAGADRLICTWYAGSREAAPDVAIYAAFYRESTGVWTEPRVLLDRRQSSAELKRWVPKLGNAVVMNDRQGGLWLFYATMLGGWSTASLNYKMSRDEGQTWSPSRKLILSPFFNLTNNVKNKGLNLSNGGFLLPVYHELARKFSQVLLFQPGKGEPSLALRRMTRSGAAIQPALIPAGEGRLTAFFRNAGAGGQRHILRSASPDVGQDWSALTATPLPNPDSGFDMIRTTDGAILGAINDNFRDRSDLTLVLSRDEGQTWEKLRVLQQSAGREYAYPSLTRTGRFYHLTYSYEKTRIKHVVFNDAWLKEPRSHGH